MEYSFKKGSKPTLTVELEDGRKITILPPKVKTVRKFAGIRAESMDDFLEILPELLSRNKEGKRITKEEIEDLFDVEDLANFVTVLTEYLNSITNTKN